MIDENVHRDVRGVRPSLIEYSTIKSNKNVNISSINRIHLGELKAHEIDV